MGPLEPNTVRIRTRIGNTIQTINQEREPITGNNLFVRLTHQNLRGKQEAIIIKKGWATVNVQSVQPHDPDR